MVVADLPSTPEMGTGQAMEGPTMTDSTTHLDELIAAERKKANARIAKLRRAAAIEQRKVDEKVVGLLRERHADQYGRLAAEARRALDAEKDERSKRAKGSADSAAFVPGTPDPQVDGHMGEGVSP